MVCASEETSAFYSNINVFIVVHIIIVGFSKFKKNIYNKMQTGFLQWIGDWT